MEKRIKLGVFGLNRGFFALHSAKKMSDEVVVTAVCEEKDEVIERVRGYFAPETVVYKDFDEFLHSGIDAVVLCNYFCDHTAYAIKAFEAGIAVLSETTAAATLGECVDLVEAAERTNARYMLAANCPYFKAIHAMKEKIENNEYGAVVYADAEYIHGIEKNAKVKSNIDYDNLHWRQTLPSSYYNMHTLGPLMYITNSVPVKVVGKDVRVDRPHKITNSVKSYTLTEMDNGTVFNTTGCVGGAGSSGKWFRVACKHGTMETERYDDRLERLVEVGATSREVKRTVPAGWVACGSLNQEALAKYYHVIEGADHGAVDFIVFYHFIMYLKGEEQPFFDVYRSVALSAAGILSWYSSLQGSIELEIPDFRKKVERDKVRGDYRSPFARKYSDLTLPCRSDEGWK